MSSCPRSVAAMEPSHRITHHQSVGALNQDLSVGVLRLFHEGHGIDDIVAPGPAKISHGATNDLAATNASS